MRRLFSWLRNRSHLEMILVGLLTTSAIGLAQHFSPHRLSYTAIFMLAIGAVAWFGGRLPALVTAISSAALICAEEWRGERGPLGEWVFWLNAFTHLAAFVGAALLTAAWRRTQLELEARVRARTAALAEAVHELERNSTQLRETLERFQQVTENIHEVFWMTDPENNRMLYVSPGYERVWGQPRATLLQSPRAWMDAVHPEDRPRLALLTRQRQSTGAFDAEYRILRPDGTLRWIHDRAFPVRDAQGRIYRIAGLAEDITDRKSAEEALCQANETLRAVFEAAPVAIVGLDLDGQVQGLWNPAAEAMLGWRREEVLGRELPTEPTANPPQFASHCRQIRAGRKLQGAEARHRCQNGSVIDYEIFSAPLRNAAGKLTGSLAVLLDITKRKRAEHLLHLERELALTLSRTGDLQTGLASLLAVVTRLPGLDSGGVYLVQEATGDLTLTAHRGLSAEFIRRVGHFPRQSLQATAILAQVVPWYFTAAELPAEIDFHSTMEGIRAAGVIPLRDRDRIMAVFNVASHTHAPIPLDTRLALESLAAQAEAALVRIRAEEAHRQSEARLQSIIRNAPLLLLAVDRAEVVTFLDGRELRFATQPWTASVGQPLAQTEMARQIPALLAHARQALAGEEFTGTVEGSLGFFDCAFSPFRDRAGTVAGFIGVITDITERVHLQRQLLIIAEREQARLGQELHDDLCQQLVGLAFDVRLLEQSLREAAHPQAAQAGRVATFLDEALTTGRALARSLFPVKLEEEGLASALEELATRTTLRHGLLCRFENPDAVLVPDSTRAIHLYRIAQEALNNTVHHAQASEIVLCLAQAGDRLHLTITDDGVGLPGRSAAGSGLGLHIMDYRARHLRGTLRVARRPGPDAGTEVSCCVPV